MLQLLLWGLLWVWQQLWSLPCACWLGWAYLGSTRRSFRSGTLLPGGHRIAAIALKSGLAGTGLGSSRLAGTGLGSSGLAGTGLGSSRLAGSGLGGSSCITRLASLLGFRLLQHMPLRAFALQGSCFLSTGFHAAAQVRAKCILVGRIHAGQGLRVHLIFPNPRTIISLNWQRSETCTHGMDVYSSILSGGRLRINFLINFLVNFLINFLINFLRIGLDWRSHFREGQLGLNLSRDT